MRTSKQRDFGRQTTKRKGLRLEALESRKLLAAGVLDTATVDHPDQPAVIVVSTDTTAVPHGPITPYIVNGDATSSFESVGIVNGGCTGTLISATSVLTAAHCLEDSDSGGFLGNREGTFEINGETYTTSKITPHPDYNTNTLDNDLAIMELDRPVIGVTPSKIMTQTPKVGQILTLVGFGQGGTTNNPMDDFGTKRVGQTPIDNVSATVISWNFDVGESNTAPGDSGGPSFVTINGERFIAGITSGGDGNPHQVGDHSFNTRIDAFASWITAQIESTTVTDPVAPPVDPVDPDDPVEPPNDSSDEYSTAQQLAEQELADYDTDRNGSLTLEELTAEFTDFGLNDEDAAMTASGLLDDFDIDGNNALSIAELVTSWGGDTGGVGDPDIDDPSVDDPSNQDAEDLDTVFDSASQLANEELELFDINQDGSLSYEELKTEFVSFGMNQQEAEEFTGYLIDSFDADRNGQLSLTELIVSWGGGQTGDFVDDAIEDLFEIDESHDDEIFEDENFDADFWDEMVVTDWESDDVWGDNSDWWVTPFAIDF